MIETIYNLNSFRKLSLKHIVFLSLLLVSPILCIADDIERHGDAYIIYLPGELDFDEVLTSLENEIMGENWQLVDQLDIGAAVKEYGKHTDNWVLSVCKTQDLLQLLLRDTAFYKPITPCYQYVYQIL